MIRSTSKYMKGKGLHQVKRLKLDVPGATHNGRNNDTDDEQTKAERLMQKRAIASPKWFNIISPAKATSALKRGSSTSIAPGNIWRSRVRVKYKCVLLVSIAGHI